MLKVDDGRLLCPLCESDYVHFRRVVVHAAPKEDADGTEIIVENDSSLTAKPCARSGFAGRGRRNDVVIELDCENCGRASSVELREHKGMILVETQAAP